MEDRLLGALLADLGAADWIDWVRAYLDGALICFPTVDQFCSAPFVLDPQSPAQSAATLDAR